MDFSLVKRKKSAGARSGEYGGWGRSAVSCFLRKSWIRRGTAPEYCHVGTTIFSSPTNQALFSSLPLSAFSSPPDNIPCSPSGHKVEIRNELHPHNQKNTASLSHCTKLAVLFRDWVMFLRPIVKTGLLFRHHSCNPEFPHLLQCSWKKLSLAFAHSTSSLLTSTWFCFWSSSVVQIWLQHNACQNFQWGSQDMWFLKFQLPLLLHEPSNNNWNEPLAELLVYFLHYFILKAVPNWSSALFKTSVPLMGLYSTHGFVCKCSFQHSISLWKCSP